MTKPKETNKRLPANWNTTTEIQQIVCEVIGETGVVERLEQIDQRVDKLTKRVDELKCAADAIEEKVTALMAKVTN